DLIRYLALLQIIIANVPSNNPNVDASAIISAPVNPDHAPAQPVGLGNGFAPHWIRNNIPNNQNGWIEEDAKEEEEDPEEEEEDPEEDLEEDDDDVMEMDNEAEVINPYMDDGSNNPPPPNSDDEETPPTSPVIPDADGQPIPPIASFSQNFHFGKMENLMSERIDTEGRVKNKFKEQDRHFVGLGCDNIKMDRTMRNVMSDLSGLKKTMPPRKNTRGNPPPPLIQDTINRMIHESVEAAIWAERENLKRKPMEFQVGDKVMLKVSPWKGVVRFGKWRKLNLGYVRPFKVVARVGSVAYKLDLPEELSRVHNTFHVSNLKKCYANEPLAVPLDGLHFDDKLQFVKEPVEIMDREVKWLRNSRVPIVKV
nr:putative reverse transcriptase domain-containing protein [Tanacetum cinerariifolium]